MTTSVYKNMIYRKLIEDKQHQLYAQMVHKWSIKKKNSSFVIAQLLKTV